MHSNTSKFVAEVMRVVFPASWAVPFRVATDAMLCGSGIGRLYYTLVGLTLLYLGQNILLQREFLEIDRHPSCSYRAKVRQPKAHHARDHPFCLNNGEEERDLNCTFRCPTLDWSLQYT